MARKRNPDASKSSGGVSRATLKRMDPVSGAKRRKDGKAGSARFEFDERQLRALCRIHATDTEMAAVLGCSVSLIEKTRHSQEWFRQIEEEERALGRAGRRRALHLLADSAGRSNASRGAVTALIFLAKQPEDRGGLGFSDRVSNEVTLPQIDPKSARAMLSQRLTALARKKKAPAKDSDPKR